MPKIPGDTPSNVMKGDHSLVAYIDRRGVAPDDPDPTFPIEGTSHHWAYNPDEGPTCRQCHMFYFDDMGDGHCTNVAGEIHPMGSCDVFTPGPNADPKMDNPYKLPKMNVTYVFNGNDGFTCKRCTAFVPNKKSNPKGAGRCKVLKPPVEGDGCCIAWNNLKAIYVIDVSTPLEMEQTRLEKQAGTFSGMTKELAGILEGPND